MKKVIFLSLLSIAGANQGALAPFATLAGSGGAGTLATLSTATGNGSWFAALTAAVLGGGALGSKSEKDSAGPDLLSVSNLVSSDESLIPSSEGGFSNLQKVLGAAGVLAAVGGMTYMYMNRGDSREEARKKAVQVALACEILGVSQYADLNDIEKAFKDAQQEIYGSGLSSEEQDNLVAQKKEAYDVLKKYYADESLPMQYIKASREAARNADQHKDRRQKAIDEFERKREERQRIINAFKRRMKPPVQTPRSAEEAEMHAMQVLHGLLPDLNKLKAMA